MNVVMVTGHAGGDAELRILDGGKKVAHYSLAVHNGEEPLWINVTAWDEKAEWASQYVTKGTRLVIQGKLCADKHKKDNVEYTSLGICAYNMEFASSKKEGVLELPESYLPVGVATQGVAGMTTSSAIPTQNAAGVGNSGAMPTQNVGGTTVAQNAAEMQNVAMQNVAMQNVAGTQAPGVMGMQAPGVQMTPVVTNVLPTGVNVNPLNGINPTAGLPSGFQPIPEGAELPWPQ